MRASSTVLRHCFLLVASLAVCVSMPPRACAAEPFYTKYKSVDDPRAEEFLTDALAEAEAFLGKPAIPVKKVYLRLSTPIDPGSNLRKDFQLCELVDPDEGVFTIYLSRKPDEYSFHGQLAHEAGHVLNARLYDCYVEGLNNVFAERLLTRKKLDWTGWDKYFRDGSDPFYGTAYLMMKDVAEAAGDEHIKTFLGFAVHTDKEKTRMHVDVNAWLKSLPDDRRAKAREAILKHADKMKQIRATNKYAGSISFVEPE